MFVVQVPWPGLGGDPLVQPALPDDLAAYALELGGQMGVAGDDLVEDAGHVGQHAIRGGAVLRDLHACAEITVAQRVHRREQRPQLTGPHPLPVVPGVAGLRGLSGLGRLRGRRSRLGPGRVERHGTPSPQ